MKISNSKKELASIISENGGWRSGEFAAQDGDGGVGGYEVKPEWNSRSKYWWREALGEWFFANKIKNHHQTVLSRAEYFHLYPAAETAPEPEIQSEIMGVDQVNDINVVESKPTIEQLASDYRNAKEYAGRKQQEADDAKADAEVKLTELVAAGEALGLVLSIAEVDPEPELVITDWRDLQVGDEVELTKLNGGGVDVGEIGVIRRIDIYSMSVDFPSQRGHLMTSASTKWKFIRRP